MFANVEQSIYIRKCTIKSVSLCAIRMKPIHSKLTFITTNMLFTLENKNGPLSSVVMGSTIILLKEKNALRQAIPFEDVTISYYLLIILWNNVSQVIEKHCSTKCVFIV